MFLKAVHVRIDRGTTLCEPAKDRAAGCPLSQPQAMWRIGWCPAMSVLQYYINPGIVQA